jgi:ABC-2 type transport system permease protein
MWIYQKFVFILGGLLIPLVFYTNCLQSIANALPFAYMIYGPSKLFVSPSFGLFINISSLQIVWILVLGSILLLAYRRGVAFLTVNGG